jgi:hypothetical protein
MMQDRPATAGNQARSPAGYRKEEHQMYRKIVIGAVIALLLVPATVLAAGYGQQNSGTAAGQGPCLQENCPFGTNQTCTAGSGSQARFGCGGEQQAGTTGTPGTQNCACTGEQKRSRGMHCTGCGNGAGSTASPVISS